MFAVSSICMFFLFRSTDLTKKINISLKYNKIEEIGLIRSILFYLNEFFQGLKFLFKNPYLMSLLVLKSICGFNFGLLEVLNIIYSDTIYKIRNDSSAMFGIISAIRGFSAGN
jgi:hypothetical protein